MEDIQAASRIEAWALEEGFDRAGFARLGPSEHADAFERWLGRGENAEMAYLERRRAERLDPRTILEGARSVVCVARQYHPPGNGGDGAEDSLYRYVARYARGEDYHDVLKERLQRLAGRIRAEFPGTKTRVYVDTGPVLERELAARAGIGSFGKNTNLLHPEAGSWFFLGEILTTLELPPSTPVADLCGSCSRCLEACPTGALPEPYHLDATRCISYWTIEHRGWFEDDVRSMVSDWLFGCDICQEVCPVNEAPQPAAEPRFAPDSRREALTLEDLLEMSREAYVELFRGSAMKRAKLEGLQRNAAVLLGNLGDPAAVPALLRALDHPEPVVRGHAAWALGKLGGGGVEDALRTAAQREPDSRARRDFEAALEMLDPGLEIDA